MAIELKLEHVSQAFADGVRFGASLNTDHRIIALEQELAAAQQQAKQHAQTAQSYAQKLQDSVDYYRKYVAAMSEALTDCGKKVEPDPSGVVHITDHAVPIDDAHEKINDMTSFQALARWVFQKRAEYKQKGSIFDTGFRCVSEGGTIFYFDPEVIVDLLHHYRQVYRAVVQGKKPPRKSMDFVGKCWMPDEEES